MSAAAFVFCSGSRSRRRIASAPPSWAQRGTHASSPVQPAVYVYMLADSRTPAARADSTRAMAASIEEGEVVGEGGPLDLVLDVRLFLLHAGLDGVVGRPPGRALAHDLRGDALADFALPAAVGHERVGGPREHVDEPGGDGEAT